MALQLTTASNFPAGFNNVTIRGVPITQAHPGQVYWVGDSSTSVLPGHVGASDGNPGTFSAPFNTIDHAIGRCTAGRGDIIFVKPGHTETLSAASAIAMDVQGVALVGLGSGSMRPTITMDTVNTTPFVVSAADCSIVNMMFIANFLTISAAITVTTAKDLTVQSCEFRDTTAAKNFANMVKSTGAANTADGLYFADNYYPSIGTTYNTGVLVADAIDRMQLLRNNVFTISTSDIAVLAVSTTGAVTNLLIADNNCTCKATTHTSSLLILGTGTAGTGMILRNFVGSLDAAAGVLFIVTIGWRSQGNSISGALAGQGFPIPALDT